MQPVGPYYLAGFSLGATIALEMSRRLQSRGAEVAFVAAFDSTPTVSDYEVVRWGPRFIARFAIAVPVRVRYLVSGDRATLEARIRKRWTWLRRYLPRRQPAALETPDQDQSTLAADLIVHANYGGTSRGTEVHHRIAVSLHRAMLNHVPHRHSGRLTLFRAVWQPLACSHDPRMGWGELAPDGVDVYPVRGSHYTVLLDPDVAGLTTALETAIAKTAIQPHSDVSR